MILPNFLGIGVGRSGSTWIHQSLKEHPDVLVPHLRKEIDFFNRDSNYEQGLEWYSAFFEDYNQENAVGEITPAYLCSPVAADRIHKHLPGAKLIISLRDPAERAFSSYMGYVQAGKVAPKTDIFEASDMLNFDNQSSIIDQGLYFQHINRFLKLFPREQMLILLYDDLKKDPKSYIRTIYDFLEVDPSFVPSTLETKVNEGKYSEALRWVNMGVRYFVPPKYRTKVTNKVIRIRKKFAPRRPELPAEWRAKMIAHYKDEILRLSDWLGRDLRTWLN